MTRHLLLLLCALAAGCGATFDVPVSGASTIPQGNLLTCSVLPAFSGFGGFDISQTQAFKNQGATKENVQSVKVQALTLKVVSPSGANLGFLEELDFYAEDPSGSLPQVEIAYADAAKFSGTPTSVVMTLEGTELAPYAELPSMNLTATAKLKNCPQADTTIEADISLAVTLKGL